MKKICNSKIYTKKSASHLQMLYYLVSRKNYLEKENTWELALIAQHFKKLISLFYNNYFYKPIAICKAINTVSSIAKPTIQIMAWKQKEDQLANNN